MGAPNEPFTFLGHGANVVGSLGSGSLVQDMPTALQFNEVTDGSYGSYVKCGDHTYTGDMTWTGWARLESGYNSVGGSYAHMLSKGSDWFIIYYNDVLYVYLQDDGGHSYSNQTDVPLPEPTSPAQWQHIGWSWDATSGEQTYYVNGVQIFQEGSTCVGNLKDSGDEVCIGARTIGTQISWEGNIRDCRIYNSVLTAPEMTDLFAGIDPAATPLNHWQCEDGSSTTVDDVGSLNMDGTITGTTGYTAEGTGWDWDKSLYNLNQIGLGSVSGSVTVSGGTWNLRDSTYTNLNGTNARYNLNDSDNITPFNDGLGTNPDVTYSVWFNCTDGEDSIGYIIMNQKGDGSTNMALTINRDDTGSGDAGQISGFLYDSLGAHVFTAYDAAANDGLWHNAVYTNAGTTQVLYLDGVEVARLEGKTFNNQATDDDMMIGAAGNTGQFTPFDGDISATIIDDTAWTAAQVDLYYKGQWVGNPAHWFKFNEGTGNAQDSGRGSVTAAQSNATWVKPDYDMLTEGGTAGALVTISGAKLSAPQAELQLGQNESHLVRVDTYIHNSGTLLLDGNTGAGVNSHFYDYGNNYYNVTKTGSGWTHGWHSSDNGDTIVENTFDLTQGGMRFYRKLNMGTTGSRGTIICTTESDSLIGYSDFHLAGVSELYPAFVTSSAGGGVSFQSTTYLSDVEWDFDQTTRGGGYNYTMSGGCKFKGLEIKLGDFWHMSGQRLEVSDYSLLNNLGTINASDATLVLSYFDGEGTFNNNANTNVIYSNCEGSRGSWRFAQNVSGASMMNDDKTHELGYDATLGKLIFGDTSVTGFKTMGNDLTLSGMTLPVGGTIVASSSTINLSDNFNMAGGFIGRGALDLDGVDEFVTGSTTMATTDVEGITIEGWCNLTEYPDADPDPSTYGYWYRVNDLLMGFANENIYVGIELQKSGGSPYLYPDISIAAAGIIDKDKWHHWAITWDSGSSFKLYIDGKFTAEEAVDSEYTELRDRAIGQDWAIGNQTGYENEINGKIARISRWNVALTEAEIRGMMFQDWATMADADVVDDSKCVQWYEFSDRQNQNDITDMSGSGNTGALKPDGDTGGWADHGTFTNDTSTLVFSGSAGTTHKLNNKDSDTQNRVNNLTIAPNNYLDVWTSNAYNGLYIEGTFTMGSGSTIQRDSDTSSTKLYFSGNSWDIDPNVSGGAGAGILDISSFNDGSYFYGSTPSGAPLNGGLVFATADTVQGNDMTLSSYIQADGKTWDTNGYDTTCPRFRSEASDTTFLFGAGSTINVTSAADNYGFGDNVADTSITASGVAGANFRGVTSKGIVMNAATDIGRGSVYKGSFTISLWVYLPADMQPTLDVANGGFFGGGGGGQPGGGVDLWSYSASPTWYFDINGAAGDERSAQSASIVAGDLGKLHHIVCVLDRSGGVDTGDGIQKLYQSISGEDATPQRIGSGSVNANFDGVSNTKLWTIGHAGLSYWTDGGGTSGPIIADFRIWQGGADGAVGALTDAQITTLYNGGDTTVNGTGEGYPDSTNSLNANTWYKLDRTGAGLTSLIDTVSGNNATYASAYTGQTGFVTVTGAAGFTMIPTGGTFTESLQNTYLSGSRDIIIPTNGTFKTKGTVVLD